MKISPSKFQVGSCVVFGGTVVEAQQQRGDPSCKKDIQSIMGAAAQMKRWTTGLMLTSSNLNLINLILLVE